MIVPPYRATSGVPYWASLPKSVDGVRQVLAEVPHARGRAATHPAGQRAERPVRVELGAGRRDGAARAGGHVAQGGRTADVGLELDLRIRLPVGLERPGVLEGGRMVLRAVRPGVRDVVQAVEVQVSVLVPAGRSIDWRPRIPWSARRSPERSAIPSGSSRRRRTRTAHRWPGFPSDRPPDRSAPASVAFWQPVGGTRALTDGVRAFRAAHAGVEGVRVAVGLAARVGHAERVLVGHRVADLGVADLLLHQHAALEPRPTGPGSAARRCCTPRGR